uniref:Uncharacterized protein n=1 Tax=Oryza glumipatula TaxID=40148 RepID=A0A0E0AMD6_9ORYZ
MDTGCCFVVATIARHSVPSCTVTDAFSGFSATAARPPPPPPNSSVKSGLACSVCFLLDVHMRSNKAYFCIDDAGARRRCHRLVADLDEVEDHAVVRVHVPGDERRARCAELGDVGEGAEVERRRCVDGVRDEAAGESPAERRLAAELRHEGDRVAAEPDQPVGREGAGRRGGAAELDAAHAASWSWASWVAAGGGARALLLPPPPLHHCPPAGPPPTAAASPVAATTAAASPSNRGEVR